MKRVIKKKRVKISADKVRLSVFRSRKHIYAQLINDVEGKTLCSASSLKLTNGDDVAAAIQVGKLIGEQAVQKSYVNVVFDRGSFVYKGRIKALAEAAREAGLKF